FLRDCQCNAIPESRVPAAKVQAPMKSGCQQALEEGGRTYVYLNGEFLEKRALEAETDAGDVLQPIGGIMGLAGTQGGGFLQPVGPQSRQVNCRPQGQQALVSADIAGRFFSANVLLACLQRENEAALALPVHGLTDKPAGHLAHKFFA